MRAMLCIFLSCMLTLSHIFPTTSKPREIISFIRSNSASFHLVTGCYNFQENIRQYIIG